MANHMHGMLLTLGQPMGRVAWWVGAGQLEQPLDFTDRHGKRLAFLYSFMSLPAVQPNEPR